MRVHSLEKVVEQKWAGSLGQQGGVAALAARKAWAPGSRHCGKPRG